MARHVRIIDRAIYERLNSLRDLLYKELFEKFKNDPEYNRYESSTYNPNGMEYNFCKSAAWAEADSQTLGREMESARLQGYADPEFEREDCGCCHNMTIMYPAQREDGDWEIITDIG